MMYQGLDLSEMLSAPTGGPNATGKLAPLTSDELAIMRSLGINSSSITQH